jgi:hypothetical protein
VPADVAAHNIAAIAARASTPGTFHVTADEYYTMADITRTITREYGYPFDYYDIPSFIGEMNRRCRRSDPLYPLLEFFNRSAAKIAAMQLKRYSSAAYVAGRDSCGGVRHPSLSDTVRPLMRFLLDSGLIEARDERGHAGQAGTGLPLSGGRRDTPR